MTCSYYVLLQRYRTLDDLRSYDRNVIFLAGEHLIALKYWDDINKPISREEVKEIREKVYVKMISLYILINCRLSELDACNHL